MQHKLPCRSKVNQNRSAVIGQHDIGWFDVAVQHMLPMHDLQGIAQSECDCLHIIRLERSGLVDLMLQGMPAQELHDNINSVIFLERGMYFHDIGRLEGCDAASLVHNLRAFFLKCTLSNRRYGH